MTEFLEELSKEGAPRATRIVRTLVKGLVKKELRDDDADVVDLPPHYYAPSEQGTEGGEGRSREGCRGA